MILVLRSPNAGLDALARGLVDAKVVDVDIADMRSVRGVVAQHRPTAVISTVWRDHRGAEADPEAAFRYDGEAAINMAAAALEFDAAACLLSVADVFGSGVGPFDEGATPHPASEYADAARRAEVFFSRAMREKGLIVRSGLWLETVEAEVQAGAPWPGGAQVQVLSAEALGRFVASLIESGTTGVVHAVPASAARAASEVYREAASRLGSPPAPVDPESALAPAAILASRHPPIEFADPTSTRDQPASEEAAAPPTDGQGDLLASHGETTWLRFEGRAGQVVELPAGGRRVSLWLREGKGLLEEEGREDRFLGPRRTMTVDATGLLRFAPATDFELFVLTSPSAEDGASPSDSAPVGSGA